MTRAKAMERVKDLGNSPEEPPGVEETACIESKARNWGDPPLHGKP